jgi:hypothetical protein
MELPAPSSSGSRRAVTEFQDRQSPGHMPFVERRPEAFQAMYLFDAMIDNFDRHAGNMLVDSRERLWLVDHTRSFRLYTDAKGLDRVTVPDADFLKRLEALDRETLEAHLRPFLTTRHIDALLRRRSQILRHFRGV